MLGDYVLVSGTPRKVEMITKKKIGYHINPQENRLYYARLKDVEPIEVTEVYVEDTKNVILNRIYRIQADGWMSGDRNKVSVDFKEGDAGFYTPFYLHDLFHVIKGGIDKNATLSIVKTYEERREDISKVVKIEDGKIVGRLKLSDLAKYLVAYNIHASVYWGNGVLFSTHDGKITKKSQDYWVWANCDIEIKSQYSDQIETFKINVIQ